MTKSSALASALRSSGATVAAAPVSGAAANESVPDTTEATAAKAAQPSRKGTKPITVHHPEEVRRQLKTLAAEQGRNVEDLVGEALNLLFAKYRKAEIAPVKKNASS
jgi:predicted HicB family RNase H-like nuclease